MKNRRAKNSTRFVQHEYAIGPSEASFSGLLGRPRRSGPILDGFHAGRTCFMCWLARACMKVLHTREERRGGAVRNSWNTLFWQYDWLELALLGRLEKSLSSPRPVKARDYINQTATSSRGY